MGSKQLPPAARDLQPSDPAPASPRRRSLLLAGSTILLPAGAAWAQSAPNFPISRQQRSTAQQVAQAGVPLADLAPNAPDSYTVKAGDTLWAIAGIFLRAPWRWPELWGMNLQQIRNPHLIFPGQVLVLDKTGGRARLRLAETPDNVPTVRVSPRVRTTPLPELALPTLDPRFIEPYLAEPIIVAEGVLERAPRIVASTEDRVLITRGDRAYARGVAGNPVTEQPEVFRVFRNAVPMRDPVTRAVLGYEAQYLGRARVVRPETQQAVRTPDGQTQTLPVPASLEITAATEEMRVGDRLLPDPPRQFVNYVPRAPQSTVEGGTVVHMYGNAVGMAGQHQVVLINKGTEDGIESGHVMAILKHGAQIIDRTQPGTREAIKLPDERNGLLMVFRPFERLSYALILQTSDGVRVGDRVVNPR